MGIHKALIPWDGRPLWQHLVEQLVPHVLRVRVIGFPQSPPVVEIPGCDFLPDPLRIGPLGALEIGLAAMKTEWAFVTACDMPFFSASALNELWDRRTNVDIVVPRSPDGYHPLFSLYHQRCLSAVSGAVRRGERRLRSFFADLRVCEFPVAADDERWRRVLININTPEELYQSRVLSSR
jgi:molybdopterin-guanine dinucleotide biosynthesis protein A